LFRVWAMPEIASLERSKVRSNLDLFFAEPAIFKGLTSVPISSDPWPPENDQYLIEPSQEEFPGSVEAEQEELELTAQQVSSPEDMLPPEARGETNGGPLGCCLGVVVGLLLTFFVMLTTSVLLANGGYLGAATLPVALLGAAICGFIGWKVGKRFYREYEPDPRQQERLERLEKRWQSKRS